MNNAAITLTGVTKTFPGKHGRVEAVRGVDLEIAPGEVVAFLGPNGAGKTTTIDMILGLSEPTTGNVTVFGMTPHAAVARGLVAAVMQTGGLLKDLTVRESVEYVAALFPDARPVGDVLATARLKVFVDDDGVEVARRLGELAAERSAKLLRLDIFRRRHEGARQDAVAGQRREILRPGLDVVLVDRISLGRVDGAVAVGPERQRRQADGFHIRAELLQYLDGLLDAAHLLGIGLRVLGVEMLDQPDAQSLHAGLQVLQRVGGSPRRAGRIGRVVTGDGVKQDRVVLDRPRHAELIGEIRQAGAKIRLISDGDVAGAIAAAP